MCGHLCLLSANLLSCLIWFSQCFFTDYPEYPEFCVSHSREKSKEGAMAVFLLSASDVQVTHSQPCATLLPAFARAASPWSVVSGFHPDSLIFCSSEAWSTHTGWFPYHFSVAIMNPHEVLVFCSPKASDYGTECWADWTPAHFGSSYLVFLCYQFYPWCKSSSEFSFFSELPALPRQYSTEVRCQSESFWPGPDTLTVSSGFPPCSQLPSHFSLMGSLYVCYAD